MTMQPTNITASNVRPSTYTDTDGAVDIDVTVTLEGLMLEGEVTLAPAQYDGSLGAFGESPDQWVSGDLLRYLRTLDDSDFRSALDALESAAGAAAAAAAA